MPSLKPHGQMSEAFITALFLSVSGGLQDAYTYLYRGKVFANAQTGNIVLMAVKLFAGKWGEALRYLIPLCAFALGILWPSSSASSSSGCSGSIGVSWWCCSRS